MSASEIYQIALKIGLACDPKKEKDSLKSRPLPYPDSQIIYTQDQPVKRIAAGIDISSFDIFFAKIHLNCDLIISHHPISKSVNQIPDKMLQQTENLYYYGISKAKTKKLIEASAEAAKRAVAGENFYRVEQLARYLNIDLMNLHTVADNAAVFILQNLTRDKNCDTLNDFVKAILELDEFKKSSQYGQTPFIANGKGKSALGKVSFSEFIGGQESSKDIFLLMKKAGVNTLVVPHLSEQFFKKAVQSKLNIIYCGHMASDSLGMNYCLNKIKNKNPEIEIISVGGLLRE